MASCIVQNCTMPNMVNITLQMFEWITFSIINLYYYGNSFTYKIYAVILETMTDLCFPLQQTNDHSTLLVDQGNQCPTLFGQFLARDIC